MNSLMTLPIGMVEKLEVEELLTVNGGGYIVFASPNNSTGTCSGANNDTGTCSGTNNDDGRCGGTNNGRGVCKPVLPSPSMGPTSV